MKHHALRDVKIFCPFRANRKKVKYFNSIFEVTFHITTPIKVEHISVDFFKELSLSKI